MAARTQVIFNQDTLKYEPLGITDIVTPSGQSPFEVVNLTFTEVASGPLTYGAFLAGLSAHPINLNNPWSNHSATVIVRGGGRLYGGWEGRSLSADMIATVNTAPVAIWNTLQTIAINTTCGGGMETRAVNLGVIAAGQPVALSFKLSGTIATNVTSNTVTLVANHSYSVEFYRHS